jgi:hypothetical protein
MPERPHPGAAWFCPKNKPGRTGGCGSIDAIDNRTIDDESDGSEFFVIEAGEESSCLKVCDLNRVG